MNEEQLESYILLQKARIAEIISLIFLGACIDQIILNLAVGKITTMAFLPLISFAGFYFNRQEKNRMLEKLGVVDEESRKKKLKELTGRDL